jgi:microcystin-dependent protein
MSSPYLSEIRIMSFNFPPRGWTFCNGQTLSIQQNAALFSLLGTTYGGNGINNFMLPNLQGCVPVGMGNGFTLGQRSGEAMHTLTIAEMPAHTHLMAATAATGAANTPPGPTTYLAQGQATAKDSPAVNIYSTASSSGTFPSAAISNNGNSQPHENRQPYLTLSFCIALQGIFPTRS